MHVGLDRYGRGGRRSGSVVLALFWAVNDLGHHWTWFATINPVARVFGAAFVLEAILLASASMLSSSLRLELRAEARSALGLALIAYAMPIYPLVSMRSLTVRPELVLSLTQAAEKPTASRSRAGTRWWGMAKLWLVSLLGFQRLASPTGSGGPYPPNL